MSPKRLHLDFKVSRLLRSSTVQHDEMLYCCECQWFMFDLEVAAVRYWCYDLSRVGQIQVRDENESAQYYHCRTTVT